MQLPTTSLLPDRLTWRQPASWLVAALLLAAFLALNVSSSGITGGDDHGSGIGGTGRTAEPGSGLGGTGLKPFLGFNADSATGPDQQPQAITILPPGTDRELALTEQLNLDIPNRRDVKQAPLPSPVQVAAAESFTRDSSAIDITEQIQRDLDTNALYFSRLSDSTNAANRAPSGSLNNREAGQPEPTYNETTNETTATELTTAQLRPTRDERTGSTEQRVTSDHSQNTPAASSEAPESLTWGSLASYLAEQPVTTDNAASGADADQTQRLERPDRVIRPELPTVQRIRPVQRAGVLPPRIRPLSL